MILLSRDPALTEDEDYTARIRPALDDDEVVEIRVINGTEFWEVLLRTTDDDELDEDPAA